MSPAFHASKPALTISTFSCAIACAVSRGEGVSPLANTPPVATTLDVFAPSLAKTGRDDDNEVQALRPCLVASPRTGRNAHCVPLPDLNDLVVELHTPAAAPDHVHLFLRL